MKDPSLAEAVTYPASVCMNHKHLGAEAGNGPFRFDSRLFAGSMLGAAGNEAWLASGPPDRLVWAEADCATYDGKQESDCADEMLDHLQACMYRRQAHLGCVAVSERGSYRCVGLGNALEADMYLSTCRL